MADATLKVGDRVVATKEYDGKDIAGKKGTVIVINDDGLIGVEFDENIGGHSGSDHGKDDHCWYVPARFLDKITKGRPATIKYIVVYDRVDRDPHRIFTSKEDLVEWLAKASHDRDIKFETIRVFRVSKELSVKTEVTLS